KRDWSSDVCSSDLQADGEEILGWEDFAWGKESTNTVVTATDEFLKNEDNTEAYLKAHKRAVDYIQDNPDDAKELVIKHLKDLTGKELDSKEVDVAFDHLDVTTNVNEDEIGRASCRERVKIA